jgi:hypothetical protein
MTAIGQAICGGLSYFCSEVPCGGEDPFEAAAKALIRSFLANRLLRCVSFTRPL